MSRKYAVQILQEKGEVIIRGAGGSMRPIMDTGDSLYLRRVLPEQLRVGDSVFCKVAGNLFVHKIYSIDKDQVMIGNNSGHLNGKISFHNIYGICYRVNDRILVSDEELEKRKQ